MRSSETENGAIPLILMLAGSILLLFSMCSAGKILWEVLSGGLLVVKPNERVLDVIVHVLGARLLWLTILFFAGWLISLINIRLFHSLVHPFIIQFFLCFILLGILAIYWRVIFRFYIEDFGELQYWRYSLAFAAAFGALISLHLLIEGHDLRPYGAPIAVLIFIHILLGGIHYAFENKDKFSFALGDASWLGFMGLMFFLIIRHFGLLNPFRRILNAIFPGDA